MLPNVNGGGTHRIVYGQNQLRRRLHHRGISVHSVPYPGRADSDRTAKTGGRTGTTRFLRTRRRPERETRLMGHREQREWRPLQEMAGPARPDVPTDVPTGANKRRLETGPLSDEQKHPGHDKYDGSSDGKLCGPQIRHHGILQHHPAGTDVRAANDPQLQEGRLGQLRENFGRTVGATGDTG